jgi:hypothetical protein
MGSGWDVSNACKMRRGPNATAKNGKGKGWPHGSVGITLSDY